MVPRGLSELQRDSAVTPRNVSMGSGGSAKRPYEDLSDFSTGRSKRRLIWLAEEGSELGLNR
jgi:hypothetical protein